MIPFLVPVWNTVSPLCKDLISRMITAPERRLTPQQVLEHPWILSMTGTEKPVELPSIVTSNLKTFSITQKVKKVVLAYLATQLSEREITMLRKLFIGLDKNGDGVLSTEEINDGIRGREDEKELGDIVESMDTDRSGFIDYNGMHSHVRIW